MRWPAWPSSAPSAPTMAGSSSTTRILSGSDPPAARPARPAIAGRGRRVGPRRLIAPRRPRDASRRSRRESASKRRQPRLEAVLVSEEDEDGVVAGQRALLLLERGLVDGLGDGAGRPGLRDEQQREARAPDADGVVGEDAAQSCVVAALVPGRRGRRARRRRGRPDAATLTRPSSAMSRLTVACVTSHAARGEQRHELAAGCRRRCSRRARGRVAGARAWRLSGARCRAGHLASMRGSRCDLCRIADGVAMQRSRGATAAGASRTTSLAMRGRPAIIRGR